MLKQEKCHNCGASLQYNRNNFGGEVTCKYCHTKYHLDDLGKVEEYKVKLLINGKVMEFYIYSVKVTPNVIETYSDLSGYCRNVTIKDDPEIEIILKSY